MIRTKFEECGFCQRKKHDRIDADSGICSLTDLVDFSRKHSANHTFNDSRAKSKTQKVTFRGNLFTRNFGSNDRFKDFSSQKKICFAESLRRALELQFFLFAFSTRENRDSQLGLIDTHTYSLIKISCKKILSKVHNMQYFTVRIGVFRDVAYLGSHPRGFPYVDIHITFSS